MGLDWNAINIIASDFLSEFWPYAAFFGAFALVTAIFMSDAAFPMAGRTMPNGVESGGRGMSSGARSKGTGALGAYINANRIREDRERDAWSDEFVKTDSMTGPEKYKLGIGHDQKYADVGAYVDNRRAEVAAARTEYKQRRKNAKGGKP